MITNERIALLIDGASLHQTVRNLGFEIDFRRLVHEFQTYGTILRAFYYTTIREDQFSSVRPLLDWLDYNGFTVRTKPAREHDDGEGRRTTKRSMGVDLAVDALEIASHVDHIFLFSGDSNFRRAIESVQRTGVKVSVVSSLRTTPPTVSDELRRQANNFIEIGMLRGSIERAPF